MVFKRFECGKNLWELWNVKKTSRTIPASIYSFEVNNGNTRTLCKIGSKLKRYTPKTTNIKSQDQISFSDLKQLFSHIGDSYYALRLIPASQQ